MRCHILSISSSDNLNNSSLCENPLSDLVISKSVGSDENENKSRKLYIKKWVPLLPKNKKEKEINSKFLFLRLQELVDVVWLGSLINNSSGESCQTSYLRN